MNDQIERKFLQNYNIYCNYNTHGKRSNTLVHPQKYCRDKISFSPILKEKITVIPIKFIMNKCTTTDHRSDFASILFFLLLCMGNDQTDLEIMGFPRWSK
ncbi:hypothetical protein COU76_04245 [Candidatus Peregrinibacteria bacterium CG10_big_fil_rev_8_21_14_0_10_49_10]|nr:MAG: hypothetical protein COU76_04245 [Candidatus Peregrinibacteria bacterium CG10_big_fil_rev_8_21_14_0_10_49_10]